MATANATGTEATKVMIVLDTNVLVYAAHRDADVIKQFEQWFVRGEALLVSTIVVAEFLSFHPLSTEEQTFIRATMRRVNVVPVSLEIAVRAAAVRQRSQIKLIDALIAATALVHGAALATRDADFRKVRGLELIEF